MTAKYPLNEAVNLEQCGTGHGSACHGLAERESDHYPDLLKDGRPTYDAT